jgi:hypothetical protein
MNDGKTNLVQIGSKGYEAGGPANWTKTAAELIKYN